MATIAVNLIPGDRVDLSDYQPNMSSDVLLSQIAGLPDNPLTQEELNLNRLREKVTTSILTGEVAPDMSYSVFRDEHGAATVSYLLQEKLPDPRLIGDGPEKSLIYDLDLRTDVLTLDGKSVYQQEDALTAKVTEPQAVVARTRSDLARRPHFTFESRKLHVVVATLTNNLNHVADATACHGYGAGAEERGDHHDFSAGSVQGSGGNT